MTELDKQTCLHCDRDNNQVPLLKLKYKDTQFWICTEHLPVLLHRPEELTGKLPDAENLRGVDHD
jgi:hypothetical protein